MSDYAENTAENDENKIPVNIITGFLGSGKTTLLNHWVNRDFFGLENSLNISAAIKGFSLLWLIGFIHHQSFAAVVETSKKI
mgnify:CR=1 FL=1